ncbi:MAG: tetratricopeptide repeat protein, partial [Fibrobacter sp.]|nr:tetratricopeptide repeat protein [Fibrobacter sp.]
KLRYQRLELIKNHLVQNGSIEQVMEIYKIEKHRIKAMISKGNYFVAERKLESSTKRFGTKINIDDLHLLAFRTFFLENKYTEALESILKVSNETNSDLKKLYRIQGLYALKRYHDVLDEIPDTDISKFKGSQKNLLIWIFIESSLATGDSINYSDFGTAIAKNAPYSIHVIHSLSRAYLNNQDTTTAISVLNGAFNYKINSETEKMALKKVKISLAQLHYEKGNYDIALSTFFQLLNDDKDYGNALFGILWCYIKLNQFEKAEITMRKLINQSPESLYSAKAALVMAENYLYHAETEWNKIRYIDSEKNRLSELKKRMTEKFASDTSLKNNEPFKAANSELSHLLSRLKKESQKGYDDFIAIYDKIFDVSQFIIDHYNTGTYQEEIFSKNRESILYYLDSLNYSIKNSNTKPILPKDTLNNKAQIKAVVNETRAFIIHSNLAFLQWQLEFLDREKMFINQNADTSDSAMSAAKLRLDSIIVKEDSIKQFFFFKLTPLLNSFLKTNSDFTDAAYFRYRLGELYYENEITEYSQKFSRYEKDLEVYQIMNDDYQNGRISQKPVPPEIVMLDHENSIYQFKYVIDNYSTSPYCGASHYSLAWCYNDLAEVDSAIEHMKKLVHDFPQSPHAPQAWMYCGEFYFDRADLKQAANCYQAVMKYPESEWFDKALYKLAWSQYRQSNPNKAISSFLALVDLGENQPNGHSLLEKESLDYIAISFSETDIVGDNGLVRANAFAKKLNHDNQGYQILHRLANVYRNQGRFDIAEKTYNIILNDYKNNPKNPVVESELV